MFSRATRLPKKTQLPTKPRYWLGKTARKSRPSVDKARDLEKSMQGHARFMDSEAGLVSANTPFASDTVDQRRVRRTILLRR